MAKPLMFDELTAVERVNLAGLKQHPGFDVLEKLMMSACRRATDAVIELDPTSESYERSLKALQSAARERSQFCLLLLKSISWQVDVETKLQEQKTEKPQENPILKVPSRAPKEVRQ
jgi:hypothetical protein